MKASRSWARLLALAATAPIAIAGLVVPAVAAPPPPQPCYRTVKAWPIWRFEGTSSSTTVMTVRVTSGSCLNAGSVSFNTEDDSAKRYYALFNHTDYDYFATSGTLNFAYGDASEKTITISVRADSIVEQDESFRVKLHSPQGYVRISCSPSPVTILNDDPVQPNRTDPGYYCPE